MVEKMDCTRCSGARRGSGGKREEEEEVAENTAGMDFDVVVDGGDDDDDDDDDDESDEEEERISNIFDVGIGIDGRVEEEDAIGIIVFEPLLVVFVLPICDDNNKRLESAVVLCSIRELGGGITRCETCREPPSGERAAGILIAATVAAVAAVVVVATVAAGTNDGTTGERARF